MGDQLNKFLFDINKKTKVLLSGKNINDDLAG